MKTNIINTCIAATLLGLSSVSAQAATINMIVDANSSTDIKVGDTVTFEIWANFADVGGTIGGGLDMFYDSAVLSYNNDFAFDPGFGADPISLTGDDCSVDPTIVPACGSVNEINNISPVTFSGGMADGLSLMGTLSFTGSNEGMILMTMADTDGVGGNWFNNSDFSIVFPIYSGAEVTVVPEVPVPAAAWLMLSGLGLLGGLARRKANA